MPIFGGSKRPKLDGLTRDEEKRRDALTPEVLRRSGESGFAGQAPAAAALLREKMAQEPGEYLWPLLLGQQMMGMRRFAPAIEAFVEATARNGEDVRGYYGAGYAYFQAGEAKQARGDATTDDIAPPNLTVDNLYHEALRCFRRAQELATEKSERDELSVAVSTVERAIARKAGRL
jgi:tetratricopeptide (TPR) repeat protein